SVTSRLCAIGTSEGVVRVRVYAAGLALTCAVPSSGLTIGRDADNDLALLSRSVSRRHVRLVPCDGGIVVQDLGATNPALLNGRMLVDGRRMWVGDTLEIRGSGVTIRPCPTR
ncbi:FHA domain-containing protein, partial [uncultured Parolsenella sp.]|uniref:FHA domain-containing protein n=1 Tax=uncultured Parolsenella sp. TaxID=2083008 RepID=UPI0027DAE76C